MAMELTITIPGPPCYELSPNARSHHMAKYKASQESEYTAYMFSRSKDPIPGPVTLDWIIRLPKRRKHMDWDNAIATLKPAMDGLVAAGVIEDDNTNIVTRIGLTQIGWREHRIDQGELEVTITPVNARKEQVA